VQTLDTIKYRSKNPIKKFLIKRFQEKLLTLIKTTGAKQVLDAGCGEGYQLSLLNDPMQDWHLEGFDINAELVNKARQKVPNVSLRVSDIYNCGYPDGIFDLVISTEVLEHLEYPEKALSEIVRLTKRWAILSVPNEPLFRLSNLLAGNNILRLGSHKGHCNKWSAKSFVNFVNRYFAICSVSKPFPWIIVLCERYL